MFPFATVVKCPQDKMLDAIGRRSSARQSPRTRSSSGSSSMHAHRPAEPGPLPTIKLNWLQPHEGSIVDFLFRARAFQFEGSVPE